MSSQRSVWWQRCWNVGILVALLGIAFWGHESKWRIPSFGEFTHGPSGDQTQEGKSAANDMIVRFESAEVVKQVGIATVPAVQRDLDLIVTANATVGYDETKTAQLSARVSGFVAKVTTYQGAFVRQGDVLAIIDAPEVGQARIDFLQAFASQFFAARRHERLQMLANKGAVSDASLREAELAALEARTRRFNAQQKLLNLGLEFDPAKLDHEGPDALAARIHALGLSQAVLRQLPPNSKSANLFPLVAPLDGVVTKFGIVAGERITPEDQQIAIADVRTMWIRLGVRREDAGQLTLGDPVLYHGAARQSPPVEGRLTWISTIVDEKTRTVEARARVDNPGAGAFGDDDDEAPRVLRANEYGSTRVKVGTIENAIMVPNQAIQRLGTEQIVFVARADGKSFEARKVEIGPQRDGWTQIRDGVAPGEHVVSANSVVLKSELMKDALEGQ